MYTIMIILVIFLAWLAVGMWAKSKIKKHIAKDDDEVEWSENDEKTANKFVWLGPLFLIAIYLSLKE